MSVLKGNISSVLRKRDNTLLDNLRKGYSDQQKLREGQLADAKAALGAVGHAADADIDLALSKAQTPDEVQNVLENVGGFADRGLAAKAGNQQLQNLLTRESTKISNLTKDLANRDVLENWQNKETMKKELGELAEFTPGTVEYKAKVEELHQRNLATGTPDKVITDIYAQEFGTADISVSPDTIQAALGVGVDMTNPDNFGTAAYNRAVSTISDKLENEWTGIRDKSVFDKRAKDLLSKSQWGQNFDRQTKLEAGETTQGIRLKERSAAIAAAISSQDPDLVDAEVNKTLNFLQANNITGPEADVFNKNIELALDRSNVNPASIFQNSSYGKNVPYQTNPVITPMQASRLTNDIKEVYRKKYPNLPDRLLDPQVAKVIKADQELGFAISQGSKIAASRANITADFMEQAEEYKSQQHKALFRMAQTSPEVYIAERLSDKFRKENYEGSGYTANDVNRVAQESSHIMGRLRQFFKNDQGEFLPARNPETLAAFRLAASKAIIGNAGIDEDSNRTGLDSKDIVFKTLDAYQEMSDTSDYDLLQLFVRALPDAHKSIKKNQDGTVNVGKGILNFATFAEGRLLDARAQGLGKYDKDTFIGRAQRAIPDIPLLGSKFPKLKPIPTDPNDPNSSKYDRLTIKARILNQ